MENKKLTTPSGKEVEIRSTLNARGRNKLRKVVASFLTVDVDLKGLPQGVDIKKLSPEEQAKFAPKPKIKDGDMGEYQERKETATIEVMVASYDGSTERIVDRLLDGSPEDYDFVLAEAEKVLDTVSF